MTMKPHLDVLLAAPRGFCAGVDRAIQIVELAIEKFGSPVYVRHEIVHNRTVVESLEAKGAVFVEELSGIPNTRAPVIFSAHGVPKAVPSEAARRNFFYLDATFVGAPNSSNSKRLVEVALRAGCPKAMLVQKASEIPWNDLQGIRVLGLTAGASAPEILVDEIIEQFKSHYEVMLEVVKTATEDVIFKIPKALQPAAAQ
ncbi:MAG: hypothetical protein HY765_03660 [Rhodomicrobium sp.]|nr:hypothetical protein [Rhodomicrobium sp.]